MIKDLPALEELGLIPGSGRSPGVAGGNPLQYSCLENSTDRGIKWAAVHGSKESEHLSTEFEFLNPLCYYVVSF